MTLDRRGGFSLVEVLVALGLGLSLAVAAVAATTTALRHLVRTALRAEAEDLAAMAVEAFTLDVRRAGFDPRAAGAAPLAEATTARLVLDADLDGDGAIDSASEEHTTLACDVPSGRISRIVGSQSLPLANGVVACDFSYADRSGAAIAVPVAGLDATMRRRVGRATLAVAVRPPGSAVAATATATTTIALRVTP